MYLELASARLAVAQMMLIAFFEVPHTQKIRKILMEAFEATKLEFRALIDEGLTPCPFFEGDYTSRLEYLAELPKGKILGLFDSTDPLQAKEILGNTMCISGMMPLSLLQTGTPESIREYAKKLIDIVGKGGGYIMGPRSAMDECDPERVKVWVNFTKEYGVYQ